MATTVAATGAATAGAASGSASAAAARGGREARDDRRRVADLQQDPRARAIREQGMRILRLLKQYSARAFTGAALHGVGDGPDGGESPLTTLEAGPWGIRVRFRVPPHLCSLAGYLTCGAVMAWFDEVSTWGVVCQDARHRPGVSVSLSTTLVGWARAGSTVVLESACKKVGENLGFAEIVLRDGDTGRPLAHGRHVKFLVMGRTWAVVTHPWVFPITRYIARRYYDRRTRASTITAAPMLLKGEEDYPPAPPAASSTSLSSPPPPPPPAQAQAQAQPRQEQQQGGPEFKWTEADLAALLAVDGFTVTDDSDDSSSDSGIGPLQAGAHEAPRLRATASVRVAARLCNNFGTLHGGAVSLLAERMAVLLWRAAARRAGLSSSSSSSSSANEEEEGTETEGEDETLHPHVRTVEVDYLSPAPRGSQVTLEARACGRDLAPVALPGPLRQYEREGKAGGGGGGGPAEAVARGLTFPNLGAAGEGEGAAGPPGQRAEDSKVPTFIRVYFKRAGTDKCLSQCHVHIDPLPVAPSLAEREAAGDAGRGRRGRRERGWAKL